MDSLLVKHTRALLKALKKDEIFDVFKNLVVDATKSGGASEPSVLPVLIVLVVAFPDPGSLSKRNEMRLLNTCGFMRLESRYLHHSVRALF